jgi:hypothetical protein
MTAIFYILSIVACSQENLIQTDPIYVNGNFITIDGVIPLAEAIAIKDGCFCICEAHSDFASVGTQAILANLIPAPNGF